MHPTANPLGLEPVDSSEPHIFISYSRQDIDFVRRFAHDLQQRGINVWIDKLGLKAGTPDWEQALRDAICESRAVLLIASESSRKSPYVSDELAIARMYLKPIYPIWAAGTEWMEVITMGMGRTQFIDARGSAYPNAVIEAASALAGARPDLELPAAESPHAAPAPTPGVPLRNPYKGLRAFRAEDRADYFGRASLVTDLLDDLRRAPAFLAVIGASGSGKSSAIMAGLLPALREGAIPGSDRWLILNPFVPGTRPIRALAETLALVIPQKTVFTIEEELLHRSTQGLSSLSRQALSIRSESRAVLYVDQFEELFTQTTDDAERTQFVNLLTTAASDAESRLSVLLSMRADFYDQPLRYPDLGRLMEAHTRAVLPMTLAELYDVVQKPAASVGLTFEDSLVGELIFDVRDQAGALPLLQFTLDQLYERRDGARLTRAAYDALGGVKGALAGHAEATYAALPDDEHRRLARALFLRLIEPGATEQDTTRRRAPLDELTLADPAETRRLSAAADSFIKARLLIADRAAGVETVEVSHEALIREWQRLGEWLHAAREDVILQKALASDAAEWDRRGRPADRLYRGVPLIEAQAWAAHNMPSAQEASFIAASEAEEARQRAEDLKIARRVQMFQRVSIVGSIILISAVLVSIFAGMSAFNATNTQATAEAERLTAQADVAYAQALNAQILSQQETAVADQATALFDRDRAVSEVALAAATLTPIQRTLDRAVEQQATLEAVGTQVAYDLFSSRSLLLADQSRQQREAKSPQTALILAVESARNHQIVRSDESDTALYRALTYPVYAHAEISGVVVWTDDGSRLAQLVNDTLIIWDAPFSEPAVTLTGQPYIDGVWGAGGARFAARTFDGIIDIWDTADGARIDQLDLSSFPADYEIDRLEFSPDGKRLNVVIHELGYAAHRALIWQIGGESKIVSPRNQFVYAGYPEAIAFSPTGDRLAMLADGQGEVRLEVKDTATGDPLYEVVVPTSGANYVVSRERWKNMWSPDGESIWLVFDDSIGLLIDAATGDIRYRTDSDYIVGPFVWLNDGQNLLTIMDSTLSLRSAADGTALWDNVYAGYSALLVVNAEETAVSVIETGFIHEYSLMNGQETRLNLYDVPILKYIYSPDGSKILILFSDDTIAVWDNMYLEPVVTFTPVSEIDYTQEWTTLDAAWNADGSSILVNAADQVRNFGMIWHFEAPPQTLQVIPHTCPVSSARWNADETRILTAAGSQFALWDAESRLLWSQPLEGFEPAYIDEVTFSPNESQVLVWYNGSFKSGIEVRDAADGALIWSRSGYNFRVPPTYSPDGSRILFFADAESRSDRDYSLLLLDAATGSVIDSFDEDKLSFAAGGAEWSPDGSRLLAWLNDAIEPRVWVWDTATGELITSFLVADVPQGSGGGGGGGGGGPPSRCPARATMPNISWQSGAHWSPDGESVIGWGADSTVRLWDVATQTEQWRINAEVDNAILNDDSTLLLGQTGDQWSVWEVASGELLLAENVASGYQTQIDWTPRQTGILIASETEGARVIDLQTGETRLNVPPAVTGAALNADESRIMLWGGFLEGHILGDVIILPTDFSALWDAAAGMIKLNLLPIERAALHLP